MSDRKQNKPRVEVTVEQKLEYAKLMADEGYSNKKMMAVSGASESAVSRWKRQYISETNGQTPEGKKALTPEQQRIQELEKHLWRAKRDNAY